MGIAHDLEWAPEKRNAMARWQERQALIQMLWALQEGERAAQQQIAARYAKPEDEVKG